MEEQEGGSREGQKTPGRGRGRSGDTAGIPGNRLSGSLVQVNVQSEQWGPMTFAASPEDRVRKISEHVRSKTQVAVQDQVLLLGSKPLTPRRTLSSYGIDQETTIHLTLRVVQPSDEALPLVLVEPGGQGQRHLLQVRRASSVAQVKAVIETKTALPPRSRL